MAHPIFLEDHWTTILRSATPTIEHKLNQAEASHPNPDFRDTLINGYTRESRRVAKGKQLLTVARIQDLIGQVSLGANISIALACMGAIVNVLSCPNYDDLV